MVTKVVPRERVEFVRYAGYWDPKRVPKCDRLVIMPIPDAVTRISALLTAPAILSGWWGAKFPDWLET